LDREKAKYVLLEIKDILDKHKVEFFLLEGTCLGAVREKNFIEHDRDIDLGVKDELLRPKIEELSEEWTRHGFKYAVGPATNIVQSFKLYKEDIRCDIPGMALNGNERFIPSHLRPYCLVQKAALFENPQAIEFLGKVFLIPNPVEEYLTHEYGKDWKTPHDSFDNVSASRVYGYRKKYGMKPFKRKKV